MTAASPRYTELRRAGPAALREALERLRARTLALADDHEVAFGDRAPGIPYAAELNPPLWELGHVGWFQEWWILRNRQRELGIACDPDHPRPPSLLPQADAWYDSSRVAHATRWQLPLPDAQGTRAYVAQVLARTVEELDRLPPDADDDALYFFRLVALHECMHAEAAVYMAQTLGIAVRQPPVARIGEHRTLRLEAQQFRMGSAAGEGFAFDNELDAHEVAVSAVEIDAEPVSWRRYLPFVQAGGYQDPRWWTEDGAAWLRRSGLQAPMALRRANHGWQRRHGPDWHPLAPDEPALHLTTHEAEAWCRWAGRRLPSEAEWECAATRLAGFRWGHAWEWTASTFLPYEGFVPHPYSDYSAPWFGSRRVLRGACHATDPHLADARYRNFFEPHRQDIFAGFRSARDLRF